MWQFYTEKIIIKKDLFKIWLLLKKKSYKNVYVENWKLFNPNYRLTLTQFFNHRQYIFLSVLKKFLSCGNFKHINYNKRSEMEKKINVKYQLC